jgi:hypothetical protein
MPTTDSDLTVEALTAAEAALGEAWSDLHEWVRTTRHSREHVPAEFRHYIGHERGMAATEAIRVRIQGALKLVHAALEAQQPTIPCSPPPRSAPREAGAQPYGCYQCGSQHNTHPPIVLRRGKLTSLLFCSPGCRSAYQPPSPAPVTASEPT